MVFDILLDEVKDFANIPSGVTAYDKRLKTLINDAKEELNRAKVSSEEEVLAVRGYIKWYARLYMTAKPDKLFEETSKARLDEYIQLLRWSDAKPLEV
jgi:predicted helicase